MSRRDETPYTAEERRQRVITAAQNLRQFEVTLEDRTKETVTAHFHESNNPAGNLVFIVIDANGRTMVHDVFNFREWRRLREVTRNSDRDGQVH